MLQLLIALRFYATGCFQNTVGEMIGISQPQHPERYTESPTRSDNTCTVGYTCQPNTKPTNKRSICYAWPAFRMCHCQGTAVAARLHDIACQFAELPSAWHVIVGEVIRRGGRNRHFEQERATCNRELCRHTHNIDYFAHSKVALLIMCTTII